MTITLEFTHLDDLNQYVQSLDDAIENSKDFSIREFYRGILADVLEQRREYVKNAGSSQEQRIWS